MKSCYSFTDSEMVEMWFMNNAANYLLKNHYASVQELMTPGEFAKSCYDVISTNLSEDARSVYEKLKEFNKNNNEGSMYTWSLFYLVKYVTLRSCISQSKSDEETRYTKPNLLVGMTSKKQSVL